MKRKNEKDHSGSGFVTPPKYLKRVFPWGILKLMKEAQPRYKVPARKYFQYSVLPSMYIECKTKISSFLETVEAVSLTSDIWTSSINNHSFISLTGHWINNDFNAYHAAIGTKPFPGIHTAEAVS